mgnify:CR=1 FL=1
MAKAYDSRVVARARALRLHLALNTEIQPPPSPDPETPPAPPPYTQTVSIDYALLDGTGKLLDHRTLTHQTVATAGKLNVAQAVAAVRAETQAWVSADRLALADNDAA